MDSISQANKESEATKKRRPTEKRKLQNRIAQKRYRENLKSRLENLEKQAAEIQESQNATSGVTSQPQVSEQIEMIESSPDFLGDNVFDFILDMDSANQATVETPVNVDGIDFSTFPNIDSNFDMNLPTVSPSSSATAPNNSNLTIPELDFEYEVFLNESQTETPRPKAPPNQFKQVQERAKYAPWVPDPAWTNGKSPAKTIDNFVRLTPDANTVKSITVNAPRWTGKQDDYTRMGPTFARSLVQQLRLDDSNENKSLVQTALARGYNIRDVFLAGLGALDKKETLQPMTGFDPYKNTLTLVPTSTLRAYISNAMALRLDMKELENEAFQSPFYQPEALASGTIAPLEAVWQSYPKALRPTQTQITTPHHPWMDMIPFPSLRDRVLTLSNLNPPLIDLLDFKNDVFMNSGLFCWKVGGDGGSGQPWDMRSWEAEPWFLKKWWIVVGGEEGEIWEQTHWWRALRGIGRVEMDGTR